MADIYAIKHSGHDIAVIGWGTHAEVKASNGEISCCSAKQVKRYPVFVHLVKK